MTARRLPKLSEVKLTRRTLVAGGAALVAAGAGVVVGVTRCSRGAADVPVEPTAGVEGSEDAANSKLGGKLSLYTSCPEELVNAGVARFSQDAGVTVAVTRGSEAELVGQLLDGDVAGKPAADVIWGGEALWYAGVDGASSGLESVQREVGAFALAEGLADGKKGTPAAYADLLATALAAAWRCATPRPARLAGCIWLPCSPRLRERLPAVRWETTSLGRLCRSFSPREPWSARTRTPRCRRFLTGT